MNDIDWSKAPEGAQYYSASDDGFYTFYRHIEESTYEIFYCGGTRWFSQVGTPKEHYTIIPRLAPAWNGEGLPPVGTVLEAIDKEFKGGTWTKVVVLAVGKHGKDDCLMVAEVIEGQSRPGAMVASLYTGWERSFRPHTPEQIAADEREAAIKAIVGLIESADSRDMTIAEAIYNAGYRKPC